MSVPIMVAEKLQVKRNFFLDYECLETLMYAVCDRDIGTIKNVVMSAIRIMFRYKKKR